MSNDEVMKAWAESVAQWHCWNSNTGHCLLSSQLWWDLTMQGIAEAGKLGFDNNGNADIGMHPTTECPLVGIELWFPRRNAYLTIVLKIDWEHPSASAELRSYHWGWSWRTGCPECRALQADYAAQAETEKID